MFRKAAICHIGWWISTASSTFGSVRLSRVAVPDSHRCNIIAVSSCTIDLHTFSSSASFPPVSPRRHHNLHLTHAHPTPSQCSIPSLCLPTYLPSERPLPLQTPTPAPPEIFLTCPLIVLPLECVLSRSRCIFSASLRACSMIIALPCMSEPNVKGERRKFVGEPCGCVRRRVGDEKKGKRWKVEGEIRWREGAGEAWWAELK
jgi:hypothetical protein